MGALAALEARGLAFEARDSQLVVTTPEALNDELRVFIREHKGELLAELELEQHRGRIWRDLQARPGKRVYFEQVENLLNGDAVRVVVAVRGAGTADLLIDRDKWDPVSFLELLDARAEHDQ